MLKSSDKTIINTLRKVSKGEKWLHVKLQIVKLRSVLAIMSAIPNAEHVGPGVQIFRRPQLKSMAK